MFFNKIRNKMLCYLLKLIILIKNITSGIKKELPITIDI